MDWDPAEDAWLSGFADGEGCFIIRGGTTPDGVERWRPVFSIGLRADDLQVLEALRARFGGRLHFGRRKEASPQWSWAVGDRRSLAKLVAYFYRFPLRAKKARDYAIWRDAVQGYLAHGDRRAVRDGNLCDLSTHAAALRAVRSYDSVAAEELPRLAAPPQLRLVTDGS